MSLEDLEKLNKKIYDKTKKVTPSEALIDMARELGCLSDILGRDYEILDPQGKLLATIRQKPLKILQINTLLEVLARLRENEKKEIEKKSSKGKKHG